MFGRWWLFCGGFEVSLRKGVKMVICEKCGGNCDNGELVGGVCHECREEERQRQIRQDSVVKMMNSQSYQMELRLDGMKNG